MMPTNLRRRPWRARCLCLVTALALAAPVSTWAAEAPPDTTLAKDTTEAATGADYDPWQRMNRGIFWFNDRLDSYVMEPVAKGWDSVMPEPVQTSISNFFANVRMPLLISSRREGSKRPLAAPRCVFPLSQAISFLAFAHSWCNCRHTHASSIPFTFISLRTLFDF